MAKKSGGHKGMKMPGMNERIGHKMADGKQPAMHKGTIMKTPPKVKGGGRGGKRGM